MCTNTLCVSWSRWVIFGLDGLHIVQFSICQFHMEAIIWGSKWNFTRIFDTFCLIWIQFSTGNTCRDFWVTLCFMTISEMKAKLYQGVWVNFYPCMYFKCLLSDLGHFWYKKYDHNAVEVWWFHENRRVKLCMFLRDVHMHTYTFISHFTNLTSVHNRWIRNKSK